MSRDMRDSPAHDKARGRPQGGHRAAVDEHEVTVVALDTGEILSTHLIEPDRRYWRSQRRARPMAGVSSDRVTHVSLMSRLMTMARPTGFGRALATYEVPIEGTDEWLAAARRLA